MYEYGNGEMLDCAGMGSAGCDFGDRRFSNPGGTRSLKMTAETIVAAADPIWNWVAVSSATALGLIHFNLSRGQ